MRTFSPPSSQQLVSLSTAGDISAAEHHPTSQVEAGGRQGPLLHHLHSGLMLECVPPVHSAVWSSLPRDPARATQPQLLRRHQVLQDEGHLPVIYVPVQLFEVPQRGQQVPWERRPEEETQALPDVSHLCRYYKKVR